MNELGSQVASKNRALAKPGVAEANVVQLRASGKLLRDGLDQEGASPSIADWIAYQQDWGTLMNCLTNLLQRHSFGVLSVETKWAERPCS